MSGVAFTPTGIILGANVAVGTNASATIDASRATDAIALPVGTTGQRPAGIPGEIRFNKTTQLFEGFILSWAQLGGGQITFQNNNVTVNTTSTLDFSNGAGVILKVIDDFANGRVNIFLDSAISGGSLNIEANGTITVTNPANVNFLNTSTVNVSSLSNFAGTTANVSFNANVKAIAGPAYDQANAAYAQANAAYSQANTAENDAQSGIAIGEAAYAQANAAYAAANAASGSVYANGTIVVADANVNFNNTVSINVAASANGSTQANIAFNINTSMNLVSLNVSGNVSNAGNILVTQNTSTGNLSVTQNVSAGNLSVANINASATINTAANLVAGNISTPQNTSTGNLSITQNTSTGNLTVTQNISAGNISAANINATTLINISGQLVVQSTANTPSILIGPTGAGGSLGANTPIVWYENSQNILALLWNTKGPTYYMGIGANGDASHSYISFFRANSQNQPNNANLVLVTIDDTGNVVAGNLTITNVNASSIVTANINGLNSNASLVSVMSISYLGVY